MIKKLICWVLCGVLLLLPLGRWLPESDDCFSGLFNRYSVIYTSQVRLKGEFSYSSGFKNLKETFFLEAAYEPTEFCSFIDGFLDGKLANKAGELVLSSLSGEGEYKIESISFERIKAPKDPQLLLEDSYSQIGISLKYPGTLDSFVWKAAPSGFSNLLNRHDEGRLVQQSYYGTTQPPYELGEYMQTPWGYNPVQGGDQHGNRSKLVDYKILNDQIYVKCQPMDWSKNNERTPSYMENTFILKNGVLSVHNRFVDFSGLNHEQARHQELPACYMVTALDTFSFYNGSQPWTNEALTQKSDLPFWHGNNPENYFELDASNTETWCAWTMGAQPDSFGVSVYSPGAEILLAGVYGNEKTFNPNAVSTVYVAPLQTFQMTSEPFEYSYYITAGELSNMRKIWQGVWKEIG